MKFQSTRPVRGATRTPRIPPRLCPSFNPRAPCGATHVDGRARASRPVSIHAPRAGRDDVRVDDQRAEAEVSIHAPRAGRDDGAHSIRTAKSSFNPRAPCGARRLVERFAQRLDGFNPRAPCGARPVRLGRRVEGELVSIHAPRAGRDSPSRTTRCSTICFNPRAPCGARRPPCMRPRRRRRRFNPRAPCGARLRRLDHRRHDGGVSIHAPRAGRDEVRGGVPRGDRVSIHAPRAGRDQDA